MKKKGFTLIELLAVIVVLAIIALIATPTILGVIEKAKKGAAISSAYGYIDAIEKEVALSSLKSQYYEDREYAYDEIGVSVKGEKPTGGIYTLKSGVITNGTFCIRGYEISYSGSKAEVQGKCSSKLSGNINLSETSGIVYVGKTKTLTISEATGELSCTSDNEDVATCLVEGTNIILNGLTEGTATITINVAESTNYTSISETYTATVKKGLVALSNSVLVGDYVSMTPTSTSYTTDTSMTGYTSSQTINPSELNLWRVIRVNDDGTIDMVSEYVSSVSVYFQGQTGYKNFVGYLNTIAHQYENSNYTVGSRHMGYNGQTEYLTDTANTVDSTSTTAPWKSSTGSSTVESQGGGDTLYTTDTDLVTNALGTLVANNPSGKETYYWLASRDYSYLYSTSWIWYYSGRSVFILGNLSNGSLYGYDKGFNTISPSKAVRPIVTLKSNVQATGSGTSADPYVLP